MTVGLVSYADNPDQVFRKVYPSYVRGETDAVLDDPQWVSAGVDPSRIAVMLKVADDDPRATNPMTGTP